MKHLEMCIEVVKLYKTALEKPLHFTLNVCFPK